MFSLTLVCLEAFLVAILCSFCSSWSAPSIDCLNTATWSIFELLTLAVSSVEGVTPLIDNGVPTEGTSALSKRGGVHESCLVDVNAAAGVPEEEASTLLFLV